MGNVRIFLSVDLAQSQLFFVNLWDGRSSFRFITSCVRTNDEFQSRSPGKSEGTTQNMVKNWCLGAGRPNMLSLHSATQRPYLRTGLRLKVTLCVCDQCGPRAWVVPYGPHWFQLHWTLDNMPITMSLAMGKVF